VRAAGVSDRQITTLRDALVDSKLAQRILSSLSPDVREPVTDAAREAFTSGVATTIKAAALVALVAAGSVMVLGRDEPAMRSVPGPEPVRQPGERPRRRQGPPVDDWTRIQLAAPAATAAAGGSLVAARAKAAYSHRHPGAAPQDQYSCSSTARRW
jgi:hypothetical protein